MKCTRYNGHLIVSIPEMVGFLFCRCAHVLARTHGLPRAHNNGAVFLSTRFESPQGTHAVRVMTFDAQEVKYATQSGVTISVTILSRIIS
jgi:hypothetical protein